MLTVTLCTRCTRYRHLSGPSIPKIIRCQATFPSHLNNSTTCDSGPIWHGTCSFSGAAGGETFFRRSRKVVVKCELCNSDEPEPRQRLCVPCMEAVARLWNIANSATASYVRQAEKAQAAAKTKRAPIVTITPIGEFL